MIISEIFVPCLFFGQFTHKKPNPQTGVLGTKNRQEGVGGRGEETVGFWLGASGSSAVPAPLSRLRQRGWEGVPGKDTGVWGRGGWRQSKAQSPLPEQKKPGSPGPARPGPLRQSCHRAASPAHDAGGVTEASGLVAKRDAVFSSYKSSRSNSERHRTCRAA